MIFLGCAVWFYQNIKPAAHFGPPFGAAPQIAIKDLYAAPEMNASSSIKVEGRITRQCPSAGCWFYLDDGSDKQIKIELGHTGLKFPQWVGKKARVEGKLYKENDSLEVIGDSVEFF